MAEKSMAALKKMAAPYATVIRDGMPANIPAPNTPSFTVPVDLKEGRGKTTILSSSLFLFFGLD